MPYIGKLVTCQIRGSVETILPGPLGDQVLRFPAACPQKHEVSCSHVVKYVWDDWNTSSATPARDPLPR